MKSHLHAKNILLAGIFYIAESVVATAIKITAVTVATLSIKIIMPIKITATIIALQKQIKVEQESTIIIAKIATLLSTAECLKSLKKKVVYYQYY